MPELPEVETVVRDLRPHLVGRRITQVAVSPHGLRRPWQTAWTPALTGCTIIALTRRGKWIRLDLAPVGGLLVHLGMTGQLTIQSATNPVANHNHLTFDLTPSAMTNEAPLQLRFRDPRRFGSADWFATRAELDDFLAARLGPEPFDLTAEGWRSAVQATRRCLKALLLDQSIVAGVGNIYADEALFVAKLHPEQSGRDTTPAEAERLRQALPPVLTKAIAARGSSIRDYVGGAGQKGGYQEAHCVYGRTWAPCRVCETLIVMIRVSGRSTHFCPQCQPRRAAPARTS